MNDYLKGKFIKATFRLPLLNVLVDGKVYSVSDMLFNPVPEIDVGEIVKVESCDQDMVTLSSVTSDSWSTCEVPVIDIEEFTVLSKIDI